MNKRGDAGMPRPALYGRGRRAVPPGFRRPARAQAVRPKNEHYNETELGFREYIRRLEIDLASKNRQIRELREAPGTLAWTADGSDAEPERPWPIHDGPAALHGAALTWPWLWRHARRIAAVRPVRIAALAVTGTAALTAAAALSTPGPAVPSPLRLAGPNPPPALHQALRHHPPGAAIAKNPGSPAHATPSRAPARSPSPLRAVPLSRPRAGPLSRRRWPVSRQSRRGHPPRRRRPQRHGARHDPGRLPHRSHASRF